MSWLSVNPDVSMSVTYSFVHHKGRLYAGTIGGSPFHGHPRGGAVLVPALPRATVR